MRLGTSLKRAARVWPRSPDGAVIHRYCLVDDEKGTDSNKVESSNSLKIDIKYLNLTFLEMFTAYREKLKSIKALK